MKGLSNTEVTSKYTKSELIARNTTFMAVRMVIVLTLNLLSTRLLLDVLGIVDYGVYTIIYGLVAMFTFLNSTLISGIQRFYNYELGKNGSAGVCNVYNVALRIQIILAVILLLTSEIGGVWYLYNGLNIPQDRLTTAFWILQASIMTFVLIIVQVPYNAIVVAKENLDFYALMSVLNAILILLATIILYYCFSDKLLGYGFFVLLINFFITFLYYAYAKRSYKELRLLKTYDKGLFVEMIKFSSWNLLGTIGAAGREQGIDLILNAFFGPVVNASRGIANQVNNGLQSFVANLGISSRPQVTKSYAQGDFVRTIALTFSISRLSSIILYMFALPLILEINTILKIWLGNNIPEYTISFLRIIILLSFVGNLNTAVSGVVHSSGIMKNYQIAGCTITLSSLPIIYIAMINGYSPDTALWILLFFISINQIVALIIMKSIIKYSIRDYINKVILPVFLLVLLTFEIPYIIHISMEESLLRLVIVSVSSILLISASSYFIVFSREEKDLCKRLLKRFLKF